MPLKRPKYRIYLNDGTEHVIEITHGDRLRGEFEAKANGLPPDHKALAMNHMTVYAWCAMARLGFYSQDFQTFKNVDLAEMDAVTDEHGNPVTSDVDPTQPAPSSDSDSVSPAGSETPPSG